MDGETFYGVRVPADADRYAFAICPREPFKTHAVTEKLRAGGWTVFGNSPQFLGEPKHIVALAREELGRLQKR